MVDQWRIKQYYDKRVLIDVGRILDPQYSDSLLCITGAQLEMLRNLTQYLHRRSTFVDTYGDECYIVASNDDWDSIQAIVAELEETLMGCDAITLQLAAIANAIRGLEGATAITNNMVQHYITEEALQYEDDFRTGTTAGDAARCGTAQLAWYFAYEFLTEIVQPAQAGATDLLVPLAMVAIASWVGTPVLGIPAGALLALLWAVAEIWEAGALENVANELFAAKNELVCAVYTGLEVDAGAASIAAAAVINELEGWSGIDKAVGRLLFAPWAITKMDDARIAETDWAATRQTPGYCAECEDVVEGSDWYARPVPAIDGVHILNHTEGAYHLYLCHEFWLQPDEIACGMVFEVTDETGDCALGRTSPNNAGCDETSGITQNTTEDLVEDEYFTAFPDNIDEVECKAALAPGSTSVDYSVRDDTDGFGYAAFGFGFDCTGTVTVTIKYIIFEGSPPE